MKKRVMKIQSDNPIGAFAGAKNVTTPVLANADGTSNSEDNTDGESGGTPWWQIVGSVGNTVSGLLGSIFPFFDKRNQATAQVVPNNNNDIFKYLIFGVLAIVVILLVFRMTKK